MTNPNVGILEEIEDQNVESLRAGDAAANAVTGSTWCNTSNTLSLAVGNNGWLCTATVECQGSC